MQLGRDKHLATRVYQLGRDMHLATRVYQVGRDMHLATRWYLEIETEQQLISGRI